MEWKGITDHRDIWWGIDLHEDEGWFSAVQCKDKNENIFHKESKNTDEKQHAHTKIRRWEAAIVQKWFVGLMFVVDDNVEIYDNVSSNVFVCIISLFECDLYVYKKK